MKIEEVIQQNLGNIAQSSQVLGWAMEDTHPLWCVLAHWCQYTVGVYGGTFIVAEYDDAEKEAFGCEYWLTPMEHSGAIPMLKKFIDEMGSVRVPAHIADQLTAEGYVETMDRLQDYASYTQDIIDLSKSKNLKKRRSVIRRYDKDNQCEVNSVDIAALGSEGHSRLEMYHLFDVWLAEKADDEDAVQAVELYHMMIERVDELKRIDPSVQLLTVEDHSEARLAGLTLGAHVGKDRWTSLLRICDRRYTHMADYCYQQLAKKFTERLISSDGIPTYAGLIRNKEAYATPELCTEMVLVRR